ncbi:MAG: DNA-binding protein [Polyangiaceae bacterium]|nr:DNA-binding protein [Polyangiaceae bacterium]
MQRSQAIEAPDSTSPSNPARSIAHPPCVSRDQRRSSRKRAVRARTIRPANLARSELARDLIELLDSPRPRTRSECAEGPRPCPHVGCKHHLYLDVSPRTGAIKLNFPDLEPWELEQSCALDIADGGGATLEDVGAIMNLTRERVRQLEIMALARLGTLADMRALRFG